MQFNGGNIVKRKDIIEFEVGKMEFGGTSVSMLDKREIIGV